jgi:hypothetical protein
MQRAAKEKKMRLSSALIFGAEPEEQLFKSYSGDIAKDGVAVSSAYTTSGDVDQFSARHDRG